MQKCFDRPTTSKGRRKIPMVDFDTDSNTDPVASTLVVVLALHPKVLCKLVPQILWWLLWEMLRKVVYARGKICIF